MSFSPNRTSNTEPNRSDGVEYWETQSADYNGVLGGYGEGTLPLLDALGTRKFIMTLMPRLCKVPSALKHLVENAKNQERTRALDVGCGVGRTTKDVLLWLVDDVVLAEPVYKFIKAAQDDCQHWRGIADSSKSVTLVQAALQDLDPLNLSQATNVIGAAGYSDRHSSNSKFDLILCQWCLGHLSDNDLVSFFQKAKAALKTVENSLIVVKENLCRNNEDGTPRSVFDKADSSLTRSDAAFHKIFKLAGLELVSQKVQGQFPTELYAVKMYALR